MNKTKESSGEINSTKNKKGMLKRSITIVALALSIFMILSLTACGDDKKDDKKQDSMDMSPTSINKDDAKIDFTATPAKDFKPRDAVLAPADGAKVHNITLSATEEVIEVSPGLKQEMWVFNGVAPAPVLHGKIGDTFNITLKNDGKMSHSLDFHAGYAAMDEKMKSIAPGESLLYSFVAEKAGIWMYHCATAPALHHIGNGMWGAVVIDPPDLAKVDHEYIVMQGELYTGPKDKPGDLAKMTDSKFDAVMFNGYVNQYKFKPLEVKVNERIRMWVLDGGPNENSSFPIIGTIFDTVYKEGNYLLKPGPGGSQALDLQPAQGGFVEFTLKEAGHYAFVTHKFSNIGKGALGLFQANNADGSAPVAGMAGH